MLYNKAKEEYFKTNFLVKTNKNIQNKLQNIRGCRIFKVTEIHMIKRYLANLNKYWWIYLIIELTISIVGYAVKGASLLDDYIMFASTITSLLSVFGLMIWKFGNYMMIRIRGKKGNKQDTLEAAFELCAFFVPVSVISFIIALIGLLL